MERRIERYKQEIRAIQAGEDVACVWLVELNAAKTVRAALLALRQLTEGERGLPPTVSPNSVAE
jgi:G:T-mismatch repair DNA endonuclease (very short patch repair protein)